MDANLRLIGQYYMNAQDLQAAIDRARETLPRCATLQQMENTRESLANYLRISEQKGWDCK
jgi:outer membrane protein assembly factor BamD (BamD/ComL family)